eukprot:TRINITY_DN8118_c0_g1_i1.p1 TRINITY_DN8118_c0_g1~~TRINITY_DN8118_c0_g1_i1.p1  ORF type:complete len:443 (+),score=212.65 TRINITY_DN8118_c0_g1_i1:88-1329(+)
MEEVIINDESEYVPHPSDVQVAAPSIPTPDTGGGGSSSSNATHSSPGSSSSSIDETPAIEVRLEAPERAGEGLSTHVEYNMVVKVNRPMPLLREGEYRGMRRYKDFLALRDQLSEQHRGHLIPPLPEKQLINRFSAEFVEYRRRELERFLQRVLSHPVLRTSTALPVFFEAHSSEALAAWQSRPASRDVPDAKEKSGGGMLSSLSSSLFGHTLSTVVGPAGFTVKEPDPQFEARKAALLQQESAIDRLNSKLGAVLRKQKELIAAEAEFAAAAALMSAAQAEQSAWLAGTWDRLADVNSQLCRLHEQRVEANVANFEDELRDGLRQLAAVREMLQARDDKLSLLQQAERNLDAKKDRLLKAPSAKLDREAHDAERKQDEARAGFNAVNDTVRAELATFDAATLHDSFPCIGHL